MRKIKMHKILYKGEDMGSKTGDGMQSIRNK